LLTPGPPIIEHSKDDRLALAARLIALRRAFGAAHGEPNINQRTFARILGLQSDRYGRYERGELEPPLAVLIALRRVTGVSLDVLIAGERPGSADMISAWQGTDAHLGLRLQWVREIIAPGEKLDEFLQVMAVDPARWRRWEQGIERPPVEKMEEVAHRTGASLDYLYRGRLTGIRSALLVALKRRHPELSEAVETTEDGNHTANDGGNNRPQGRRARRA